MSDLPAELVELPRQLSSYDWLKNGVFVWPSHVTCDGPPSVREWQKKIVYSEKQRF